MTTDEDLALPALHALLDQTADGFDERRALFVG